jgi:hypothetical protein
MTVTVGYLADPPQLARLFFVVRASSQYLVGDRITSSSNGFNTYVCTGAGVSPSTPIFDYGTSPVTWGTSTWEIQPVTGWSSAATAPLVSRGLWYVDAYAQVGYTHPPSTPAIMVDPTTMVPTQQRPVMKWPSAGGTVGEDVLFAARGGTYAEDYNVRLPYPSVDASTFSGVTAVASKNVRIGGNSGGSRGCEFVFRADASVAVPNLGRACNVSTFGDATGAQPILTTIGEYCHVVPHNGAADHAARSYTSVPLLDPTLTPADLAYVTVGGVMSDLVDVVGHYNTLMVDYGCYRQGVFASGEQPHSYSLATIKTQNITRLSHSPWLMLPSTLTGSRTVTGFFFTEAPYSDLTNADIWVEMMYAADATSSHLSFVTTMPANFGALSPAGLTALSLDVVSTWYEGYTLSELRAFKVSIPVTIGRGGVIYWRFVIPSLRIHEFTTFFCPMLEIV